MSRKSIEGVFAGLTQAEAEASIPRLQVSLSQMPFENPVVRWNSKKLRLEVSVEYPADDEELDQKVEQLLSVLVGESVEVKPDASDAETWERANSLLEMLADSPGDQSRPRQQVENLGRLYWEKNLSSWEMYYEIDGHRRVRLNFPVLQRDDDLSLATSRAIRFVAHARTEDEAWRIGAATELLAVFNDSWNKAEPIDAQTFCSRMNLSSIDFDTDGSTTAFYDDGDIFLLHLIVVYSSPDGTINCARIEG